MKRSLQQIAEAVGARLVGEAEKQVSRVSSIESAGPDDLVFVAEEKHLAAALHSRAGAIIAGEFASSVQSAQPLLISNDPKFAFSRAARLLQEPESGAEKANVHEAAVVHASAKVGTGV